MSTRSQTSLASHRIGAVAARSGVPVSTLRVWQIRYAAFQPHLTTGRQRLYTDDDVLRATLLKRLIAQGHAIRSIANQDAAQLNALLHQHRLPQGQAYAKNAQRQDSALAAPAPVAVEGALAVAVIGLTLAARLTALAFEKVVFATPLHVVDIFPDVEAALGATLRVAPQCLLVRVNSLHTDLQNDLQQLTNRWHIQQVIVLYRFGQEHALQSLRQAGILVRRDPVTDYELADLISSSLLIDAPRAMGQVGLSATIPLRKFDDATLARMAAISSDVLCECPRHVAEIITLLVGFEQYSQECLNKSAEDAQLHAYLHSVSGTARALFEHALQRVADHEGLPLD